jgi:hypothetical protein
MNRKSVTTVLLVVSLVLNVVFFVFAFIQKNAANTAHEKAQQASRSLMALQIEWKAELDECEGMRGQSDQALEDCERKILAISNRK